MENNLYTQKSSKYLNNNPSWHIEDSYWKAQQVIKILKINKIEPKTICELGCGVGEILNSLYSILPNDVNYIGYDISQDAILIAKHKEKDRLNFTLDDYFKTDIVNDLLIVMDVFEHVDDYLGFINKCKDKAKYIIFHIPLDLNVIRIMKKGLIPKRNTVGHLHYFTKETAIATLKYSGLEVINYFYTEEFIDLIVKKTIKEKLFFLLHKFIYKINKDFAVRFFGGTSLLVLTK